MDRPDDVFSPDSIRAARLSRAFREKLYGSLRHMVERCAERFPADRRTLDALLEACAERGRAPVALHSLHSCLLRAIETERHDEAARFIADLAEVPPPGAEALTVTVFSPEALGPKAHARALDLLRSDPSTPLALAAPPPAVADAARQRIIAALRLLRSCAPALAGEIESIVSEIYLAVAAAGAATDFDGFSSFDLWGAITLNADSHHSPTDMAIAIVHEAAHLYLFALALDEPLVRNAPAARYRSPLRPDPRPMDGIVHAAFVIARMHLALSSLSKAGHGPGDAMRQLDLLKADFADGLATIHAAATLTKTGRKVVEASACYMA